ncbi:MAG TPA: YwiC-like family protein [Micromonosporaceae bacterium]
MTPRAATAAQARTPRPAHGRRRRQFVPPQHGAWAMLVLPYLAGVIVAGFRWPDLPLLGAWIGGYLLSYYALQAVKTRRPGRFREQLLLYGAITAPLAVLVVAVRPEVLWYAPGYAVLLAVNAWYAWRRQERALLNDIAAVAQSCLMVFVTATVAGVPLGEVLVAFLAVFGYFTGTVCYVKTMIRERDSVAYRWLSVAYHVVAFAVAAWLSLPLAVVFGWLLARAWIMPGGRLSPKQVGVIEIGNSALVLVAVILS